MQGIKILVVDDIQTNVALITAIIKKLNVQFETASNGKEALQKLETFSPHIVLLDLMMPDIDGLEMIKIIRKDHTKEQMAIIVTSALTDDATIAQCKELGANEYITKPIMPNELLTTIQLTALNIT